MDKKKLLKKIEELRDEMHKLLEEKDGEVDSEVIKKSEELDEILNEYQTLLDSEE